MCAESALRMSQTSKQEDIVTHSSACAACIAALISDDHNAPLASCRRPGVKRGSIPRRQGLDNVHCTM